MDKKREKRSWLIDSYNVKQDAADKGMTIGELADAIGVSRDSLYKDLQDGKMSCTTNEKIEDFFNRPVCFYAPTYVPRKKPETKIADTDQYLKIFGANLERLVYRKYRSQKIFAGEIGITESSLSAYIKGKRIPRLDTAIKMAVALDVKLNDLFKPVSQ